MKDAVWFLLWWTVGFTYPSLSASIIWGLGQQDSYTVDQLHWLFCVTNICVDLGNYILITVYDAFWCKFQNSKVVHGCVVQPYWVFVSCHWGWWSWPWQALWEILLQAPAHDVAQRSIRAWKDWVYTETMTAFLWNCELSEILIYNFFFYYFKGILFLWHCKTGMRSSSTECWPLILRNSCPLFTPQLLAWLVSTMVWLSGDHGELKRCVCECFFCIDTIFMWVAQNI